MPITCWHCATELPDHAKYCLECGRSVRHIGRTRVFAIENPEGKVGKTTTAVNLAAYLADAGRKTLVIDICPNARATTSLGIDPHRLGNSIYEVLVTNSVAAADAIKVDITPQTGSNPNLSLLPANFELYAADIELADLEDREYRLTLQPQLPSPMAEILRPPARPG